MQPSIYTQDSHQSFTYTIFLGIILMAEVQAWFWEIYNDYGRFTKWNNLPLKNHVCQGFFMIYENVYDKKLNF